MTSAENTPATQTARGLLTQLQKEFQVIRDYQPLAIGIDKQIIAQQPEINRKLLRGALGIHTKSLRYLKTLQNASTRLNLDGTPAGETSDEQRKLAAQTLFTHFKQKAAERKQQEAAEEAARERAAKLDQLAQKFARK